jgi:hypothetical protein
VPFVDDDPLEEVAPAQSRRRLLFRHRVVHPGRESALVDRGSVEDCAEVTPRVVQVCRDIARMAGLRRLAAADAIQDGLDVVVL